ncbi:F-box protein SKIP2-like protein [Tanacetum coccineum]
MITVSGNSLVEVHLIHVYISDISLLALSKCSSLQVLHLECLPHCTNTGLISVAENCKGLKKLYIDDRMRNMIQNDGLIAIAKCCLNLEELVLIGVDACCISLEAIAVNCRKLERLDLCSSKKITDLEISYIAEKCVALKKLLIRQCCVSDKGVEAFALGCPNLVEIRLTKCENVTHEVKDRLRARRGSLVVKLDAIKSKIVNAIIGDCGVQEHVVEVPPATEHVVVSEP